MEEYIKENLYKYAYYDEVKAKEILLKEYLNETDYIIIKMYETVVQGGSIIEMLKEYKEVLTKRKEARKQINELEEHLALIRRIKC